MGAHKVIIPLLNGRHFWFVPKKKKGERGLHLGHITYMIEYIALHYDGPTPRFTEADLIRIVWRLLYKREPHEIKGSGNTVSIVNRPLTFKQQRFVNNLLTIECMGNKAKAARLAGYSPRRAKQTAYDLLHNRKRY